MKHETEGGVKVGLEMLEAYIADQESLAGEEEDGDGKEEGNEDQDGEDDEEEEEEDQNRWVQDEDMRPAPNFLRDVNCWYLETIELSSGNGGWSGGSWHDDVDRTRALLRKYGWPRDDFDGDAFLAELKEPARE